MLIKDTELFIKVDFEAAEEGLKGTIDIPLWGAKGLTLANISFESSDVSFEISELEALFFGKLRGDKISGEFGQLGVFGTFELNR